MEDEEVGGDGGENVSEAQPAKNVDADRVRLEFADLLNEIEERLADEAGYGHGV